MIETLAVADGTTAAVRAAAVPQPSSYESADHVETPASSASEGLDVDYRLGLGVTRRGIDAAPERRTGDPVSRPLRIYTVDPGEAEHEGGIDVVNVPFERLKPGPVGRLLQVDAEDPETGKTYPPVDLDDPSLLVRQGLDPTPADPRFHQQMVYAVSSKTYAIFQRALGRELEWGFEPESKPPAEGERLRLRPFAMRKANACYDKSTGTLDFGYFNAAEKVAGVNIPRGSVFTSLSHDVVVHEMTHALLDGLRAHFSVMSGPDMAGFHEGFADLVSVFQHFSYKGIVRDSLKRVRGKLSAQSLLTDLATQLGHTIRNNEQATAMRSAIVPTGKTRLRYDSHLEAHKLGNVLLGAVFTAFTEIHQRRTEKFVLLATGGTGTLPRGEIPIFLLDILAAEASKLADQFLSILIRAVDYCPPVDVQLGEYLRAIITADRETVASDPLGYRATLTRVFGSFGLYPPTVRYLSEDELSWKRPEIVIEPIDDLTFARLRFEGDPAHPAGRDERRRQACALGRIVSQPRYQREFGLSTPGDPALCGDQLDLPCVESLRTARRIGPNGQMQFDLVAEVTQRRVVSHRGGTPFELFGGSTIIIDPTGRIRYVITKSVTSEERLERQQEYIHGAGRAFWQQDSGVAKPSRQPFALLDDRKPRS